MPIIFINVLLGSSFPKKLLSPMFLYYHIVCTDDDAPPDDDDELMMFHLNINSKLQFTTAVLAWF